MTNLLLGSGIIGNIARAIFNKDFYWVPFKRSRYYSFDVPFADNFLIYDQKVSDFFTPFKIDVTPVFFKCPISYQGQLMFQEFPIVLDPYLSKVYGEQIPSVATKLLKSTFSVYQITAQALYHRLEHSHEEEIQTNIRQDGELIKIDLSKKEAVFKNGTRPFDKIISTIPLDALHSLCSLPFERKARSVCYYYIISEKVDLEGATQALVADSDINFFKVCMLRPNNYIFWTLDAVENPLQYFGKFLTYRMDIVEAKRIENVIPLGDPPSLKHLEEKGIYCVGSNAQYDDFMDISSCVIRMMKLSKFNV